jgi:hypothetical protein
MASNILPSRPPKPIHHNIRLAQKRTMTTLDPLHLNLATHVLDHTRDSLLRKWGKGQVILAKQITTRYLLPRLSRRFSDLSGKGVVFGL